MYDFLNTCFGKQDNTLNNIYESDYIIPLSIGIVGIPLIVLYSINYYRIRKLISQKDEILQKIDSLQEELESYKQQQKQKQQQQANYDNFSPNNDDDYPNFKQTNGASTVNLKKRLSERQTCENELKNRYLFGDDHNDLYDDTIFDHFPII